MKYKTKHIVNLTTGEPLELETTEEDLDKLKTRLQQLAAGTGSPLLGQTPKKIEQDFEYARLPSFQSLIKCGMHNDYTEKLHDEILTDFGITPGLRKKIIENKTFTEEIKPWFEGICWDGGRASVTIGIAYQQTKTQLEKQNELREKGETQLENSESIEV